GFMKYIGPLIPHAVKAISDLI
uniref:Kassinatuerin-1 n=1 Tax=Kassina senegalensis TaxID=8415 RepID=KAS1_KASSE|nr:RecName: Full=Kassinatuerin-1 [Kassina senegalensis]